MAYGDIIFVDDIRHIENHEGQAICGASTRHGGFYHLNGTCTSCRDEYSDARDLLDRWNTGKGLEGSKPIQDDTYRIGEQERPVGLGAFDRDWSGVNIERKERKR